jgi:GNAT superfamily N-acetyltransferase
VNLQKISRRDKGLIDAFLIKEWGSETVVSKGVLYAPSDLQGFICREGNEIIGLLTYVIQEGTCEIITINSKIPSIGMGTRLLKKVIQEAKSAGCNSITVTTTNDNTNAIRFYQRRGFEWTGFNKDAVLESRRIKPSIPFTGCDGIPIQHELWFTLRFHQ